MMLDKDLDTLKRQSSMRLAEVSLEHHRYLYTQIDWSNRLICLKGARGVGKSTLLLQHIRECFAGNDCALYVSLDNMWFQTHELADLADYFYTHGGTHLFLDEIHYLPHWQTIIKNIYDNYPHLNIVYTGSSMLQLSAHEGDLSRRQVTYVLRGMSFREFLLFENYPIGNAVPLQQLLAQHESLALPHVSQHRILTLFAEYLKHGYYPFYLESGSGFFDRLQSVARQVIENELPQIEDISYATIHKIQKMLIILSERVPFTPKMSELYRVLETNRDNGLRMLYTLQRADMLSLFSSEAKNLKALCKPDKIYLENTNLMYCLSNHIDRGTLRETFFYNQLRCNHEVLLPRQGDFEVDRAYIFEVGGQSKTFDQIKDLPNGYLAVDDIEIGSGHRIPLWMFGLLY
jgi:uncharacterized protein